MSLVDEAMENCVMIDKVHTPDSVGGFTTTWQDGASFHAAITFDMSMESRIAEKSGVSSRYTVTVSKAIMLEYHDVFRRESDKKVFRVTSDGDDKKTPNSASFQYAQVTAEEWILP